MNKESFVILVNAGHNRDTAGKCSPEFSDEWKSRYGMERFYEYQYNKRVATALVERLEADGYNVFLINPEANGVSLSERVRRANKYCAIYGKRNCIYVSIHHNASMGSDWTNATGYSAYVANNASTRSRMLAGIFERNAAKLDMLGNRWKNTFTYDYYEIKNTHCPAILTESAFYTNKGQVEWMLSDEGFNTIVQLHYDSIVEYYEHYSE